MNMFKKDDERNVKLAREEIEDFTTMIENDIAQLKMELIELFPNNIAPKVSHFLKDFSDWDLRCNVISDLTIDCVFQIEWENGPTKDSMIPRFEDAVNNYKQRICDQSPFKSTEIWTREIRTFSNDQIIAAANTVNQYLPQPYLIPLNTCNIKFLMYESYSLEHWAMCDLNSRDL